MFLLHLSLFTLMQAHFCWSQYTMIAPSQPIIASVGSDVTLPCELDPVKDLRDLAVEWARQDLTPPYVYILRDGVALMLDQNSLYLGRTALSESRLQKGDMSLSLTRVKSSDGGTYQCFMPQMNTRAEVTLLVVSVAPVSLSLTKERSGSPVLRCESRGWYPEPELEWLDSEGTVLLRTEAQRGASDELFSVSSRLSVEQRLGNTLTCRVKQQESGQSREAQLRLTDEFLEACSSCAVAWLLFALGLCLVAAAAVSFVVWKFKINKTKTRTTRNKPEDCEEVLPLMKQKEKSHSEDQKVTELQEDLDQIIEELQAAASLREELQGTKNVLTKIKEKLVEYNHDLDKTINRKEKERKKNYRMKVKTLKIQIEEFTDFITDVDTEMSKIDKIVHKTMEKKGKLERDKKEKEKQVQKEKRRLETAAPPETERVVVTDERKGNDQETDESQMKATEAKEEKKETLEVRGHDDRTTGFNDGELHEEMSANTQGPTEAPPPEAPPQGPTEAPPQGPTKAPPQGPTEAPPQGPTEAPPSAVEM
ncbi:butyrophilin subfamily 2 member A1-like [Eucyclogobius newberryi]|uniref:butyrophilin subfamily 2 member A1-like n=1 Tax=Eucyclogobius newberryi TaxID=166745 RepID=UPI003B5C3950